jgi:hypothetical protein
MQQQGTPGANIPADGSAAQAGTAVTDWVCCNQLLKDAADEQSG